MSNATLVPKDDCQSIDVKVHTKKGYRRVVKELRTLKNLSEEIIQSAQNEYDITKLFPELAIKKPVLVYRKNDVSGIFFVMRYTGHDLKKIIKYDRIQYLLNTSDRLNIAVELLYKLKKLFDNNIIHRDIAPENITVNVMNKDLELAIIDFGISRKETDPSSKSEFIGHLKYVAPEQVIDLKDLLATNRYSVGLILAELFGASLPNYVKRCFRPPSEKYDEFVLQTKIFKEIDCNLTEDQKKGVFKVVSGLIIHDPSKRLSSTNAISALEKVRENYLNSKKHNPEKRMGYVHSHNRIGSLSEDEKQKKQGFADRDLLDEELGDMGLVHKLSTFFSSFCLMSPKLATNNRLNELDEALSNYWNSDEYKEKTLNILSSLRHSDNCRLALKEHYLLRKNKLCLMAIYYLLMNFGVFSNRSGP